MRSLAKYFQAKCSNIAELTSWVLMTSMCFAALAVGMASVCVSQTPTNASKREASGKPGSVVFRLPSNDGPARTTFSRIHVSNQGKKIFVARDVDKSVFALARENHGSVRELSQWGLPFNAEPGDAAGFGKEWICVLEYEGPGRLAFFRLKDGEAPRFSHTMLGPDVGNLPGPRRVLPHPKANVLYVLAYATNQIWVVSVANPEKPALIQGVAANKVHEAATKASGAKLFEHVSSISLPQAMDLDADGEDLYVASFHGACVHHFRVSPMDGTLIHKKTYDWTTIDAERNVAQRAFVLPLATTVSTDGKHVYLGGAGNSLAAFERNDTDGTLKFIQILGAEMPGLADMKYIRSIRCSADGKWVAVSCAQSGSVFLFKRGDDGKLAVKKILQDKLLGTPSFRGVSDAVFSPDGRQLLFTSSDVVLAVMQLE